MEKIWFKEYDAGVPTNIDIPDTSVHHYLTQTAQRFPNHTALIFYNRKITFAELNALTNQFAAALQANGF